MGDEDFDKTGEEFEFGEKEEASEDKSCDLESMRYSVCPSEIRRVPNDDEFNQICITLEDMDENDQ